MKPTRLERNVSSEITAFNKAIVFYYRLKKIIIIHDKFQHRIKQKYNSRCNAVFFGEGDIQAFNCFIQK